MRIAVDYDDVLANFLHLFIQEYNNRYGDTIGYLNVEHVDDWDLCKITHLEWPAIEELFTRVRRRDYRNEMPPIDANCTYWLHKLDDEGHELFVLTSNPVYVGPNIQRWLKAHGIAHMPVVCVDSSKAKFEHDFDVIIDDRGDMVKLAKEYNRELILYARRHNRKQRDAHHTVAFSWSDVYRMVHELDARLRTIS